MLSPVIAAAVMILDTAACFFGVDPHGGKGDKLTVAATTTMLSDMAREIGGRYVEVEGLMGSGVDPHQYKAGAGDAEKLRRAQVVLYNGLHLEGKLGEVLSSREGSRTVICAGDGREPRLLIKTDDGAYDPHIWYDVALWRQAAEYVARELGKADPAHAAEYTENLRRYDRKLERLDRYIREQTEKIPSERRVLVTAHDAFAYFGRAYGFEVVGLQGINTASEAGTADISRLADYIAEREIPALFVETSVSPKSVEALCAAVNARGFRTETGGVLYSDSLGDRESGTETYIKTFRANIDAIVRGLGG